jgi:hypothetical protein
MFLTKKTPYAKMTLYLPVFRLLVSILLAALNDSAPAKKLGDFSLKLTHSDSSQSGRSSSGSLL